MSSSADSTGKGYSWRGAIRGNVLMMGLVSLFTDFSSEMIYPLLGMFITGLIALSHQGMDAKGIEALAAIYIGLLGGVSDTISALLKLVSGRISDRLGSKALVAVGYGISTVARPLMAVAGAAWQVVALRAADRVGKGTRTSPRDALIADAVDDSARGLAFSFHRAMDHTGAVLGPIVGVGILYLLLGEVLWKDSVKIPSARQVDAVRWLFAVALIPGLLAMLTIFTRVREIPPKRADRAGKERIRRGALRELPKRFYAFVGVIFLFSLGNSDDLFLLYLAQRRFGVDLLHIIGLWIALHISKIIFSFPGGVLSDRIGRRPMMVGGWAVYALVYLGMAFASELWQFWALILVYGCYYGLTEGVEKAVVADFIPSEHRATAYGVYHAAEGVAKLPASLMFGVFWAVIGAKVAFSIGAGLAGGAAILMALLLSSTRKGVAGDGAASS